MLYIFVGQVRSGKTVSLVNEAKAYYDEGYAVLSNTWLNFPFLPLTKKVLLNWKELKKVMPPKFIICIDEIHALFDSRNFSTKDNKKISYFITQLGKFTDNKQKGLTVIATTQFFSQMDIRGRRITYKICECKKIGEVPGVYTDVYREWKVNRNLILKTVKREKVRFTKADYTLYDTQKEISDEEEE